MASVAFVAAKRILIVGAGHVGLYAALRMSKKLRRHEAEVTVVDPQPHMTYQPFLPEAAAGNISPRHTVVPLRRELQALPRALRRGHPDRARPQGGHRPADRRAGPSRCRTTTSWWRPARVSRTLPIPGLREQRGRLQDHRRGHLPAQPRAGPARRGGDHQRPGDPAAGADVRLRRRRLRRHRGAGRDGGHGPRRAALLPGARPRRTCAGCWSRRPSGSCPRSAATWAPTRWSSCAAAAIDIRLGTRLESCVDGIVKLSDGDEFAADTIVWTAGVKPHPMLERHRPAARRQAAAITCLPDAAGRGPGRGRRRGRLERRRLRRRAGPDVQRAGGVVLAERAARGAPGRAAGRQHRARSCAARRRRLQAQARRLGREPRPAQGRRAGLRRQGARAARRGSCTARTT